MTTEESNNQSLYSRNEKIALVLAAVFGGIFLYSASPILVLFLSAHFDELVKNQYHELLPNYISFPSMLISCFSAFYFVRRMSEV